MLKRVSPTSDLAFKKILASEDHKTVTQGFLKDFFGVDVPLDDIHIVNPYSIHAYEEDGKTGRRKVFRETSRDVTIAVSLADVTVELQMHRTPAFIERSIYYATDMQNARYNQETRSLGRLAADRFGSIRPAWSLAILGYTEWADERPFRMGIMCDEETREPFEPRMLRIGYYELTKPDTNPARARWQQFLLTGVAQPDDPGYLREAAAIIEYANLSREERRMVTSEQRAADYYDGGLVYARQEGIQQGMQQGIEQGMQQGMQQGTLGAKLDAARAALRLRLTHDQVMAITGLDAATVDQLAGELVSAT